MQYVCHTIYHVYIACIQQLAYGHRDCGIVLMDNIPQADVFARRIEQESIFNNVMVIRHSEMYPEWTKRSFHLAYFWGLFNSKKEREKLSFLLNEEVYLFTDYSNVGGFLMRNQKKYHLLEDGCDTFAKNVHSLSGRQRIVKDILFSWFKIPYAMGMSEYCIDVEVNDAQKLETTFSCKVHEKKRNKLIASLTKEQINKLLKIFEVDFDMNGNMKTLLLITQPLAEMYLTKTDDETVRFYEAHLKEYSNDHRIYVKPHPRDAADYSKMLNGNVTVIDRSIPIEILNYLEDVQFDIGITYSSTSLNGVSFCKEVKKLAK